MRLVSGARGSGKGAVSWANENSECGRGQREQSKGKARGGGCQFFVGGGVGGGGGGVAGMVQGHSDKSCCPPFCTPPCAFTSVTVTLPPSAARRAMGLAIAQGITSANQAGVALAERWATLEGRTSYQRLALSKTRTDPLQGAFTGRGRKAACHGLDNVSSWCGCCAGLRRAGAWPAAQPSSASPCRLRPAHTLPQACTWAPLAPTAPSCCK